MTFKHLEGETAVVVTKGVYKQVDLYVWNGKLFVAHSGGYVRLKEDGVQLQELQYDGELFRDGYGRLCVEAGRGRKALADGANVLRLGSDQ